MGFYTECIERMSKHWKYGVVTFVCTLLCLPVSTQSKAFETSKQLEVFHALFRELDQWYVDSIAPHNAIENGIKGLMSTYDPYTNYIPESETQDLKFMTTGSYGGVGAIIGVREGRVLVMDLYENMPAAEAGLLIGDELLEIDGVQMTPASQAQASELLKGEPETEVHVRVQRLGAQKPLSIKIMRKLVQIHPVTYAGLLTAEIGYIHLNGFTEKAALEVRTALLDLKKRGATRMILDVRGNGGGLLDEAVSICNLFVEKGAEIVRTRGKLRQWDQTFKTTHAPVDTLMPLVVLVNSGSASSSEIVSGALQDLDRAVILGGRTFGKGLVQTTRSIPYNGVLKVTTAKYYIPSGRCIQAIDYAHRNEDGSVGRIPDSLTQVFYTRAGRPVRDGGGIEPDVACSDSSGSEFVYQLVNNLFVFDFATRYRHEKGAVWTSDESLDLTDADYQQFVRFVKEKGFHYEPEAMQLMKVLQKRLQAERLWEFLRADVEQLEQKLVVDLDRDLQVYRSEIESLLRIEIAGRYGFQSGKLRASLQGDPCVEEALDLLKDEDRYKKLLR